MKTQINLLIPLLFAFLVLMQGCEEKQSDFQPIYGGFGVAAKWVGVDSGPGAELYFKDQNSKLTLIWPFLGTSGYPMLFTNDMAFFIADMPDEQGRLGSGVYFAVQATGPALDVSEDLLKFWTESKKLDFGKVRKRYVPLRVWSTENGVKLQYAGYENEPEATFAVSWEQVSNIIQDVKRTGKEHIIKEPHVVYLKKDYDGNQ